MLGKKLISAILALMVIGIMTLSDFGHLVFELEKVAERVKIENEELEEDAEVKHWLKYLMNGDPSCITPDGIYQLRILLATGQSKGSLPNPCTQTRSVPLFIQYCTLRIHLS